MLRSAHVATALCVLSGIGGAVGGPVLDRGLGPFDRLRDDRATAA